MPSYTKGRFSRNEADITIRSHFALGNMLQCPRQSEDRMELQAGDNHSLKAIYQKQKLTFLTDPNYGNA